MNWDPSKVQVIVDGHVATGFAEDSMITGSRQEDKRSAHVGASGEVTFVKSANDLAEVTITLKDTSPTNEKLKQLYNSDEEFDFSCEDQNFDGDVGVAGSRCVVQNLPDFEKGNDMAEREWVLLVADYEEAFSGVL